MARGGDKDEGCAVIIDECGAAHLPQARAGTDAVTTVGAAGTTGDGRGRADTCSNRQDGRDTAQAAVVLVGDVCGGAE